MPQFISKFVICAEINNAGSTASDISASDEESDLNAHLQRQLEEDIARIFDESIYSDLEVVCGKLKILTHTCILKTRTSKFFHKLENILHVNIGRKTFDEIYSFVSDVYTECNIEHQEHEIITYLNKTFNTLSPALNKASHAKEDISKTGAFCIPDCTVNSCTKNLSKRKGSSPSTELTKEYYALVPINGDLLEKELIEQDKLSDAFLSIITTQTDDKIETKVSKPNKPTSLPLYEKSFNKSVIHSNTLSPCLQGIRNSKSEDFNKKLLTSSSQVSKFNHSPALISIRDLTYRDCEPSSEKVFESIYSPDSLTDELSSSSDYLSATNTCSPGTSVSSYYHNLNPSDNFTKMERTNFNVTDSGIENSGKIENLTSQIDITLTDTSLSESNLHSCNPEEAVSSQHYAPTPIVEKKECQRSVFLPSASDENITGGHEINRRYTNNLEDIRCGKSTKEEKQRQNEEIVIFESSSLSSETGSWESVFPPKFCGKDRHITKNVTKKNDKRFREDKLQDLKRADSFVVEETEEVNLHRKQNEGNGETKVRAIPIPSQPVPCFNRYDRHYSDLSEGNDRDDSLESGDCHLDDFDLNESSPHTIFDMTLDTSKSNEDIEEASGGYSTNLVSYNTKTPNNSILSVREKYLACNAKDKQEFKDFTPVASSSLCVGDHFKANEGHINHKSFKRDINNIPILSGAYNPEINDNQLKNEVTQSKPACGSAWIVDMSRETETNSSLTLSSKKSDECVPGNSKLVSKNNNMENKSQCVVESDVSEKSSHTFFVDLSSLPEPLPSNKGNESARNEKDNMFTMYIDIGKNSIVRGKPPTLHSNNSRKSSSSESRPANKNVSNKLETPESSVKKNVTGNNSLKVFEKLESLCDDPNININEIIKIPESLNDNDVVTEIKPNDELNKNSKPVEAIVTNKNSQDSTLENAEESVTTDVVKNTGNNNLFVKLSDLDKPIAKPSDIDSVQSKSKASVTLYEDKVWDARMTRSIPDNSWADPNFTGNSIISSFHSENALSLNRLFPNLINKFSRSVPASLSNRTRSPLRLETSLNTDKRFSDTSEISSLQSSACRSIVENTTTEESSQTCSVAGSCQSRLGQDLLRMFLEEIATDVTVEVNGKRIKAHKCILSSRCQFFAGILSGGYVESAGNVIALPPFSYDVTHFVMCHIYAGISVIPDSISILELATLNDMLGLEGLKEAIMFTLKAKYCHHFHKPCQVCIAGVLECFPLSSAYGLDDLYLKCLKWITKYFVRVWPTKAFATLPSELLEKCYHHQIVNFTTESVIDSVFGYGLIIISLQNNRWGELLHRMCSRLIQAAAHYTAQRLVEVLQTIGHIPDNAPPAAKRALEDCLTAAIELAQPQVTCRAYAFLSNIVRDMKSQQSPKPDALCVINRKMAGQSNLLALYAPSWRLQCEGALVRAAPRVVNTKEFQNLPFELRKRLRELGCILFVSQAMPQRSISQYNPKRDTPNRYFKGYSSNTRSLNMSHVRAAFVPYSTKPAIPVATMELHKNCGDYRQPKKPARPLQLPKVRMTKAQEQRAKFNMSKNNQNKKQMKTNVPAVKSQYLEPRMRKETGKPTATTSKAGAKMISSSESSRNSSPSQVRRYRMASTDKHQICEMKAHMSQDSLATSSRPRTAEPSTDSQSESHNNNKYATYTKGKRGIKGSVESIQSTKCHAATRDTEVQGKMKTKARGSGQTPSKIPTDVSKRHAITAAPPTSNNSSSHAIVKCSSKCSDRIISGSLMNATKSSSAKIVPKLVKTCPKHANTNKTPSKASNVPRDDASAISRSGTFVMDEPTSIDNSTPANNDRQNTSNHSNQ